MSDAIVHITAILLGNREEQMIFSAKIIEVGSRYASFSFPSKIIGIFYFSIGLIFKEEP
jgi:hypothetical protein